MYGTYDNAHCTEKSDPWKAGGARNELAHSELKSDIVIAVTRTDAILRRVSTLTFS